MPKVAASSVEGLHTLSDYEQLREAKIARNQARLDSLGLGSGPMLSSSNPSAVEKKPRKRKPKRRPRDGTRKSLRKLGAIPHYNLEESVAKLDEYDPESRTILGGSAAAKRKPAAKKSNNGGSGEDKEARNVDATVTNNNNNNNNTSLLRSPLPLSNERRRPPQPWAPPSWTCPSSQSLRPQLRR